MHRLVPRGLALAGAAILFLLALPALATASVSTGDGGWVWQTPTPEGNGLWAVTCPDGAHAWAVGSLGLVVRSTNGGLTWAFQHAGTRATLDGVALADSTHAWAVGSGDTVVATTNGGRTWARFRPGLPSGATLTAVTSVGRAHVWAVGNHATYGYLLRSVDGGHHWKRATTEPGGLRAVDFGDSLHGCAVGDNGLVMWTANGGLSWSAGTIDQAAATNLSGVSFATRNLGWAVGAYSDYNTETVEGYIFRTTDGGRHWTTQDTITGAFGFAGISAVSSTTAYTTWGNPGGAPLLRTTDGGATWTTIHDFGTENVVEAVTFGAHGHGIAVGDGSTVLTSSGGSSWTHRLPHGLLPTRDDTISFGDARHGWAVGELGDLLATTDAGAHWRQQTSPMPAGFSYYDCDATDAHHAWVVGHQGLIMATTDGGTTWQQQDSGLTTSVWAVKFWDGEHGITVGGQTSAVGAYTTDGGATWTATGPGGVKVPYAVTYRDAQDAVMVGQDGLTALSTDGGASWSTLTPFTSERLLSVAFADPDHGWTVGDDGTIFATTDGGTTWQPQHCETTRTLHEVTCVSPTRAWTVSDGGHLFATVDGGAHWLAQNPGTDGNLFTVCFTSATRGYIGGEFGILTTTTAGWHVTGRPVTKALAPATVGSSGTTTLRYEVLEHGAPGSIDTVTVRIKTLAGEAVETLSLGDVKVGVKHSFGVMPVLKKGHYRWYVYATDAAGNAAKARGWNTLTVK